MPIKTSGPMNNNFDTSCLRANSSSGRVIKYSGKSIESGTYNVKLWKSMSSLRQVEGAERSSVLGMSCLTTVLLLELTLKAWKVKRNARRIQCILRSTGGTVGRLPGNAYLWLPISFFLGPPPCRKAILLFIRTPYIARMSCAISRRMHFQCNPPRKTYKKCQIATKKKKARNSPGINNNELTSSIKTDWAPGSKIFNGLSNRNGARWICSEVCS